MDFSWSDEQSQLRDSIAKFAREELNHGLSERDQAGEFNRKRLGFGRSGDASDGGHFDKPRGTRGNELID